MARTLAIEPQADRPIQIEILENGNVRARIRGLTLLCLSPSMLRRLVPILQAAVSALSAQED